MLVFARQFTSREAVLSARFPACSGFNQQIDHRGISEIDGCGIHQRRHTVLVNCIHIGAARDQQAGDVHAIGNDRVIQQRETVVIRQLGRKTSVQQSA